MFHCGLLTDLLSKCVWPQQEVDSLWHVYSLLCADLLATTRSGQFLTRVIVIMHRSPGHNKKWTVCDMYRCYYAQISWPQQEVDSLWCFMCRSGHNKKWTVCDAFHCGVLTDLFLKPVFNWANVCSPNILRTLWRTMIRFLIELLVHRIWFGQSKLYFVLNWLVMRCKLRPKLAADSMIKNVG